jgi:hypothetical protein
MTCDSFTESRRHAGALERAEAFVSRTFQKMTDSFQATPVSGNAWLGGIRSALEAGR